MSHPANTASPGAADALAALEAHRSYLVRYAMLQLRDPVKAEDAVQETLLAALENQARFAGKSQVRTWLTGILKHKIVDQLRAQSRETAISGLVAEGDGEDDDVAVFDALFNGRDHWGDDRPSDWGDPERTLENKRFWETFEMCSKLMSAQVARVFMMREVLGLSTEEICKDLSITPTNCWVMLYRARMSLRMCLEKRWFGEGSKGK
ncbi:MAG: sigma-70 family RNA polymerase sigma factor [Betaproteobacteria bacterium]|nr:sigma-70 family RNA polymerase sigma factor [Betaproteobacteria bacterium]